MPNLPDPYPVDVVYLPFHLAADDQPDARPIASVPVYLPEADLAAILFEATGPGEIPPGDTAERWRVITEYLLYAGVEHLTRRLPALRTVAYRDADNFLWWESCRDQVRRMFPKPGTDTGPES